MTITTAMKDAALNGSGFTHASLHTAFPGTTGANEVAGGSYAQKAIVVNASSGGVRLLSAAVTFNVPACTVKWIGFWNNGIFLYAVPNGGATPKNFMAVPSTDTIHATGHGWADTQRVVFFGVPPGGLTEGTTYFVRDSTTDNFRVAATAGGAAIDLTTASSFGCVVIAITETVYSSPDTHQLTAATITIAD